jgi:hypothetical protein
VNIGIPINFLEKGIEVKYVKLAFFQLSVFLFFSLSYAQSQDIFILPKINGEIRIDGLSDESIWETIEPLPLVMSSPSFRGTPTERTEIRIGYDKNYIYASARFYDSEPSGIRGNSFNRDGSSPGDDHFGVILDTFNDNENALAFFTTPAGIKTDAAVFNDAQTDGPPPFNDSWNTFWDVATVINEKGWFVEMRIPFSSLRFQDKNGEVVMGLIAWRYIARKNETLIFPEIPPKWDWGVIKPSVACDVLIKGVKSEKPVYFTPYALGGLGQSFELNKAGTKYNRIDKPAYDIGLDVKYSFTSNLTLDVTANTDFAQVEADDQQINLTRFSLFFPEKRLFFQERSSIFEFNTGGPSRLFYSRRIGFSESGPVRIYGGGRIVGRIGNWDLGILDIQTAKSEDLPSENFGVVRFRKQVLNPNSYTGGMFTSKIGNDGTYNLSYGFDGIIRLFGDEYLTLNWSQTFEDKLVKKNQISPFETGRARIQLDRRSNTGFGYEGSLAWSGVNYDPALGFITRSDYIRIGDRIFYGWYSPQESILQNHKFGFGAFAFLSNRDGSVESAELGPEWSFNMKSGSAGGGGIKMFYEDIPDTFNLSDNVYIPTGNYRFYGAGTFYQTPFARKLRTGLELIGGMFYDGWIISFNTSPAWIISRHLELSGENQFNFINFPERNQKLIANVFRLRIKATLDVHFSTSAFIQYNTESEGINLNIRFRYNFAEGNDFYLVYNEGINTERDKFQPELPFTDSRTILMKFTYTFQR